MNRKKVIFSVFAIVLSVLMMSTGSFAKPPQKVLDTYDVGVNDAEKLASGWSSVGPGQDGTSRQVWESFWAGNPEQNSANARSASFTLSNKGKDAKVLSLDHFDGAFDDSFDVYMNGVFIYHYKSNPSLVSWVTTDVNLPANIGADVGKGLKTYNVVIRTTGDAYPGFASTGQVAFDKIELLG